MVLYYTARVEYTSSMDSGSRIIDSIVTGQLSLEQSLALYYNDIACGILMKRTVRVEVSVALR
jgi:hypothetical protein